MLGEDEATVDEDVELPPLSGDRGRVVALRYELGRETRGPFVVARSGRAVEDLDRHARSVPCADMATTPTIAPATSAVDVDTARALIEQYAASLDVDLCFQDFDREVADLPGAYAPPSGRLLLARGKDGTAAGCVALRRVDAETCEMKRLYVADGYRGVGLGRALAERLIGEARAMGYRRMCLDTLPSMNEAAALYESLGFRPIEPYYESPVVGARFLGVDL